MLKKNWFNYGTNSVFYFQWNFCQKFHLKTLRIVTLDIQLPALTQGQQLLIAAMILHVSLRGFGDALVLSTTKL